jgi:adenosylcobinamide-GDP ribazoletransferase
MFFFPLVGLILGTALAWFNRLTGFWPPVLADCLTVALMVVLTRGLHLEGLADTADGLAGGMGSTRALEIMKDHNSGAFAVMAVALDLLLRWAALMALEPGLKFPALILMATAGRWSMVVTGYRSPYPRPRAEGSTGLARPFVEELRPLELIGAGLTALAVGVLLLGSRGFILMAGVALLAFLFRLYLLRRLGGVTGDTLGAMGEIAEVGVLLTLAGIYG